MQVVNKEINMDTTNRFIIQDNNGIIGLSAINEKQAIYNYNRNKKRNSNNV